jgi:uncharacterized RDD family membrane protein YckC
MTNPYAPPRVAVQDVIDPRAVNALADRSTRLGAAFLDGLVALLVYTPLFFAALSTGVTASPDDVAAASAGPAIIVGFAFLGVGVITWVVLTIKFVSANGQTIGKRMVSIKVVRSDGSKATLGRIFWLRNVVNGLLSIIPLYGLIEHLFIFGETRQCLHDKIADTIVVKA